MDINSLKALFPGASIRPGAVEAAAKIKMLVLDVDGVCTDGRLLYQPDGTALKSFSAYDGLAIQSGPNCGLPIGVITGRDDPCVRARMTQLGVQDYVAGHSAKLQPLQDILARRNLQPQEVAFLGDDWIDLDPLRLVGLPMAVANARPEVKPEALFICATKGGDGAVREAMQFILACREETVNMSALWTTLPRTRNFA